MDGQPRPIEHISSVYIQQISSIPELSLITKPVISEGIMGTKMRRPQKAEQDGDLSIAEAKSRAVWFGYADE